MSTEPRKARDTISMVIGVCDTLAELVPTTADTVLPGVSGV